MILGRWAKQSWLKPFEASRGLTSRQNENASLNVRLAVRRSVLKLRGIRGSGFVEYRIVTQ